MAYRIIIQSERTPEYLKTRIDAFLESYGKTIQDMSEAEIESHKRSAITNCLEKLQNLSQESDRLWRYITEEYFDFELGRLIQRKLELLSLMLLI
jgi:insulysin